MQACHAFAAGADIARQSSNMDSPRTRLGLLVQGYAVLSVDLDIVLFKDPLDGAFNPLMNRELDAWVAVDNGKMLNCGFYFLRPTEPVRDSGRWPLHRRASA